MIVVLQSAPIIVNSAHRTKLIESKIWPKFSTMDNKEGLSLSLCVCVLGWLDRVDQEIAENNLRVIESILLSSITAKKT